MKIGDRHQLRQPLPPPLRRRKLVPVPNFLCLALFLALLTGDLAAAQAPPTLSEAQRGAPAARPGAARRAPAARQRPDRREGQARRAPGEAAPANASAAALAARIEA